MSSLAFSESHYPARRAAVRHLTLVEAIAIPLPAPLPVVSPQAEAKTVDVKERNNFLTAIIAVLLAHAAVVAWLHSPAAPEAYVPPEIPPIVVDLAPQPELPPPPQPLKKELPPPPVQKVEPRPEPQPVADPVKTEVAPVEAPVTPPPPVAAAPTPAPVEKITEPDAYAGYLRNPAPSYPAFAQEQGWEGRVLLQVHVLANGKPATVQLKKSSGRKVLDEAAIRTVQRWSFAPAKRGSTPVDGWVEVPIDYKLN